MSGLVRICCRQRLRSDTLTSFIELDSKELRVRGRARLSEWVFPNMFHGAPNGKLRPDTPRRISFLVITSWY